MCRRQETIKTGQADMKVNNVIFFFFFLEMKQKFLDTEVWVDRLKQQIRLRGLGNQ